MTAHYRGEKSMSCLPTNPAVYDELLHIDASKRSSSIPYWPFDPLEGIHGELESKKMMSIILIFDRHWRTFFGFGTPFARLVGGFEAIFLNPRLVTSNNTFEECRVISYVGKHLFCDPYWTFFLKKCRSFGTSLAATRFILKTWTTICWVDP